MNRVIGDPFDESAIGDRAIGDPSMNRRSGDLAILR
jgi:hypothetical protein